MGLFSDDDEDEAPAPADAAPPAAATPPSVNDYIRQKYKIASDDSGVRDAQDAAQRMSMITGLGQAAEGFARAGSQAHGGQGVNHGLWQGMNQQAQQRIGQAQQARQGAMQNVLGEHQLDNQLTDEDPNSDKAKSFQATVAKMYPGLGGVLDGMSYGEMQKNVPSMINAFESNSTRQAIADGKASTTKELADVRAQIAANKPKADHYTPTTDADGNLIGFNTATGAVLDTGHKGKPSGRHEDPEKTYADVGSKFEAPRGNKSLQQVGTNLLNIENAERLMAPYANNLDKMPQKQTALLTAELEKIASGGAGSEGGRASISAHTLQSKFNDFMSNVKGDPTGADLGGFLKDNATYLKDLKESNLAFQNKHHRDVWQTNKGRLTDEQQDRMRNDLPDFFKWEKSEGAGPKKDVAYSAHGAATDGGTAVAGPGGKQVTRKQFNKGLNKTRITYSDGTTEDLDGQQ